MAGHIHNHNGEDENTTTTTSTTTTTVPWATFAGKKYNCEDGQFTLGRARCTSESWGPDIYCDSIKENSDCSEYWFPLSLSSYKFVIYFYKSKKPPLNHQHASTLFSAQ